MASILLAAPAIEPLTLAEAKLYLRVEHGDEDALIGSLLVAARAAVEDWTHRALIAQVRRFSYDRWPGDGRLALAHAPVRGLVGVRVYGADNVAQAIDPGLLTLDGAAAIVGAAPWALPPPGRAIAGIELDVELGYGTAGADVPEPLRQAIRLFVGHLYEHRGLAAETRLFAGVAGLVAPYRMLRL